MSGNHLRGGRKVEFGSGAKEVALTLDAMARLEEAFGIEAFEDCLPLLGSKQGEGDSARFIPNKRALLKFWRAVLDGNGMHDVSFERAPVNPFALWGHAVGLVGATREAWFAADVKPGGSDRPLGESGAGDTGSA